MREFEPRKMDEFKEILSNESPISGNIRGYYKGFSIQITCRDPQIEVKPLLDKMVKIADYMDENGFKPSWNDDTNKAVTTKISSPDVETSHEEEVPVCPYHNKPMTKKQGQYGEFWSCGTKLENGEWCKYRPPKKK